VYMILVGYQPSLPDNNQAKGQQLSFSWLLPNDRFVIKIENMEATLTVKKNLSVEDLQKDFNSVFPFLRIEFYKKVNKKGLGEMHEHIAKTTLLSKAGIKREGTLKLNERMTVGELEKLFREQFGANVQVSRKSGTIWLETTMTDGWTLGQQNEHGRELSTPIEKKLFVPDEPDYDQ
jgi:hypothetical protein